MIRIENLTKQFHGEGETVTVLSGLAMHVQEKTIVSVEGASGEGKSTLLNIIGTVDQATTGSVMVSNREVTSMSEREKEQFRAHELGFIFQHHYLLPDFTILENAMMPLLIQRNSIANAALEAERVLAMVGLAHRLQHFPSQVSGGEMARAGVARALVGGKKLILADEPTGNLDKANSDRLADLLWQLQGDLGFTLVIVTHDPELAARVPIRHKIASGRLTRL
ncbi:MAG: ABC transporter ATP-binding protein [Spirochaetales bacterium]|nr:ABC transporter ATP-binding protein [Leptospiraceae bacterium]MCP5483662.1 ABC transporter ATP-binding protein [Spirochaetales bacterium]